MPVVVIALTAVLWASVTFKVHKYPSATDAVWVEGVIAAFLNYPAFAGTRFLPSLNVRLWDMRLGLAVLPTLFLQWAFIGLAIDRKLHRVSLVNNRPVNLAVLTFGLTISLVLLFETRGDFRSFYEALQYECFWIYHVEYLAPPIWAIIGVSYFGRNVWTDVRSFFSSDQGRAHELNTLH